MNKNAYATGQAWTPPKNDLRPIVWTVGQVWDTGINLYRVVSIKDGTASVQQVDRVRREPVTSREFVQRLIPKVWTFVGMHRRD